MAEKNYFPVLIEVRGAREVVHSALDLPQGIPFKIVETNVGETDDGKSKEANFDVV